MVELEMKGLGRGSFALAPACGGVEQLGFRTS